jgi:predicted DNA-binding protein (MmcQ/YjbR family)
VKKKIFVFLGEGDATSGISVKLDESLDEALAVDGAAPTGYGLGRAGWVSVPITGRAVAIGELRDWIEESYRRVAPKTLVRELDERGEPGR